MQDPKNRHLGTIAQLCRAISSQLRHVSPIREKLVKQQYVLHMSHNMVNFGLLAAEICWRVCGTPANFQWVSRLGSVTARHSGSGCQLSLNKGRHLYLPGRPLRWAMAHISSYSHTKHPVHSITQKMVIDEQKMDERCERR